MLWVAVLAAVGIGAMSSAGSTSDSFTLPDTQSQKGIDLLGKEFPQASAGGASAQVVFEAPDGQKLTSGADKAEARRSATPMRPARAPAGRRASGDMRDRTAGVGRSSP